MIYDLKNEYQIPKFKEYVNKPVSYTHLTLPTT